MCETVETCKRGNTYWVQSRREVLHPGNPDVGVEPFRSGVSVMTCARHPQGFVSVVEHGSDEGAHSGVDLVSRAFDAAKEGHGSDDD